MAVGRAIFKACTQYSGTNVEKLVEYHVERKSVLGVSMPERKKRRISKAKAIQNALGQLGWHASGKEVVAFLANFGIEVNEGLVCKVKVDSLKGSARVKRLKAKTPRATPRPMAPFVRKKPVQRTYRR